MKSEGRESQIEKKAFLTKVAEVMKGMVAHVTMMATIQRACMRGEAENMALMRRKAKEVDRFIEGIRTIGTLGVPDDLMDVLVLRFMRNTQFLACLKETHIDVSGLDGDLAYWKKTMLFKPPKQVKYVGKRRREPKE